MLPVNNMSQELTCFYQHRHNLEDEPQIVLNEDFNDLSNEPLTEVQIHVNNDDNVSQITEMELKRLRFSFPSVYNLTLLPFKVTKPPSKTTKSSIQGKWSNKWGNIKRAKQINLNETESQNDLNGYQESFKNLMIVNAERFEFLKNVPYLYSEYRNSRNKEALSSLIRDACSENCILKTPSFSSPLEGRHFVVELMDSMFKSVPDNKIEIQSVKISNDKKRITTAYIGTGNPK